MKGFTGFWEVAIQKKDGPVTSIAQLVPQVDELWKKGVKGLAGLSVPTEVLEKIHFPGQLALLALGKRDSTPFSTVSLEGFVEAVVRQAHQRPRMTETNVTRDILTKAVEGIVQHGTSPQHWFLDRGVRGELAETISEVATRTGFPALVNGELLGDLVIAKGVRLPEFQAAGITDRHIQAALTLLGGKGNPLSGLSAGNLGDNLPLVVEHVAKELAFPVTREEAITAGELLVTGEFFHDATSSLQVTLRTVPKLLLEAPRDVITLPGRVFGLVKALSEGMLAGPTDLQAILKAIVTSETPKSPALLQKALDALYDFGTFRNAANLVWELTAPDNQSLRLALLLFARANGVPVTPEHLEAARALFKTDSPDLGPTIVSGVKFLEERYGGQIGGVLKHLLI